ncbi:hypothetical protein ACN28E_53970 [Archangium lansingense]|uniref:hypothetical protein n=1 Tax=Archangium lansingense TaxID=2995310 RepID=UPI003B7EF092
MAEEAFAIAGDSVVEVPPLRYSRGAGTDEPTSFVAMVPSPLKGGGRAATAAALPGMR